MSPREGGAREDAYLSNLPLQIVEKPGWTWTPAERDKVWRAIFDAGFTTEKGAVEDRLNANGDLRRLKGYIVSRVREADAHGVESAIADCSDFFGHSGAFLDGVGETRPQVRLAESGKSFVEWFHEQYGSAAAIAPARVAKHFEKALAALAAHESNQPFNPAELTLQAWLNRLLRLDSRIPPPCSSALRDRFLREAMQLEAQERFDPSRETFRSWFIRGATHRIWEQIARFELIHPFCEDSLALADWFVGALSSLPTPSLLLRGYRSFDPAKGRFDQWFFGVVVKRAISELRRKLKNRVQIPLQEWKTHHDLLEDSVDAEDEAFWGWSAELFEAALQFSATVAFPRIRSRLATAFPRYAHALRLKVVQGLSYSEMAVEFKSEENARKIVSRALEALFAIFGVALDAELAVAHARKTAPWARREEFRRLEHFAPFLLAVYPAENGSEDSLEEAWIGQVADRFGVENSVVRQGVREAWRVVWSILDADGKTFRHFEKPPLRVTTPCLR